VKFYVKLLFVSQPNDSYPLFNDTHRRKTIEQVTRELRECEAKHQKRIHSLARLEHRFLEDEVDRDVYQDLKDSYEVERDGIRRRMDELLDQLNQLGREHEAAESLEEMALKYQLKLLADGDRLTNEEWRSLFTALNLRLRVEDANGPFLDMRDMVVEVGVPLRGIKFPTPKSGTSVNIVSDTPGNDLRNSTYHISLNCKDIIELANQVPFLAILPSKVGGRKGDSHFIKL